MSEALSKSEQDLEMFPNGGDLRGHCKIQIHVPKRRGKNLLSAMRHGRYVQFSFKVSVEDIKKRQLSGHATKRAPMITSSCELQPGPAKLRKKTCMLVDAYDLVSKFEEDFKISRRCQGYLRNILFYESDIDKQYPWRGCVFSCIDNKSLKLNICVNKLYKSDLEQAVKDEIARNVHPEKLTKYLRQVEVVGTEEDPEMTRDANPSIQPTSGVRYRDNRSQFKAVTLTAILKNAGRIYALSTSHLTNLTQSADNVIYKDSSDQEVIGMVVSHAFRAHPYAEACLIELDEGNVDVSAIVPYINQPLVKSNSAENLSWLQNKEVSIITADEQQQAEITKINGEIMDSGPDGSGHLLQGFMLAEGLGYQSVGGPGSSGAPVVHRNSSGELELIGSHIGRIKLAKNDNHQPFLSVVQDLKNAFTIFSHDVPGEFTFLGSDEAPLLPTLTNVVEETGQAQENSANSILPSGSSATGLQRFEFEDSVPRWVPVVSGPDNKVINAPPDTDVRGMSPEPDDNMPDVLVRDQGAVDVDAEAQLMLDGMLGSCIEESQDVMAASDEDDGHVLCHIDIMDDLTMETDDIIHTRLPPKAAKDA